MENSGISDLMACLWLPFDETCSSIDAATQIVLLLGLREENWARFMPPIYISYLLWEVVHLNKFLIEYSKSVHFDGRLK